MEEGAARLVAEKERNEKHEAAHAQAKEDHEAQDVVKGIQTAPVHVEHEKVVDGLDHGGVSRICSTKLESCHCNTST